MNRRDFLKTVCGALGAVVSGWIGWSRAQAASPATERPDAADAVWDTSSTLDIEWMSVPLTVIGEGRFYLVENDGTAMHVYLPVVRDGD